MTENEIARQVVFTAIELHKTLGPGLLESVYKRSLAYDLMSLGLTVQSEVGVPLSYKELTFETGYRLDLLIENKVILEIKSVETLIPVHYAQLLTYLKLSDKRLGLLMNFNSKYVKDGINRVVNNLLE